MSKEKNDKIKGDKMLITRESGGSVYGISLYYYHFCINLKLLQSKRLKKTDAILGNKMCYVQYKILNSQPTHGD